MLIGRLISSNDASQLSTLGGTGSGVACAVGCSVGIRRKGLGIWSDVNSIQVAQDSCQYWSVHADFMKGYVVDLDGVDPVANIFLHPFAHFAISDIG